jgi:hypothetical protein
MRDARDERAGGAALRCGRRTRGRPDEAGPDVGGGRALGAGPLVRGRLVALVGLDLKFYWA